MRLILLRNPEHAGEQKHILAGKEVGLSLKGQQQSKLLCKQLEKKRPVAIYSSDFVRSKETIRPFTDDLGLEIIQSSSFRPFNVGKFWGWTEQATMKVIGEENWQEIFTKPDPQGRYFTSGETLKELSERSWRELKLVLKNHFPKDTIVISTHLTVISCILCSILEVSLTRIWFWGGTNNRNLAILIFKDGKWSLQHYGSFEYLENI